MPAHSQKDVNRAREFLLSGEFARALPLYEKLVRQSSGAPLARQLSDRHTPTLGTRSLDLLHIAAALTLEAMEYFSFDDQQRKAAASEGLKVKS